MFGAPHEGVAKGNKESIGGEKRTFRAKPKTIHIPQPTISGVLKVVCNLHADFIDMRFFFQTAKANFG